MSDDEHVLDEYLGTIHECALALQMMGRTEWALKVAEAHERIQNYLIQINADELDGWLSEEGILTGARSVRHMEFDCNWRNPYRVEIVEWDNAGRGLIVYIGESRESLNDAIRAALAKARGKVEGRHESRSNS